MFLLATVITEYAIIAFILFFFLMIILTIFCHRRYRTISIALKNEKQKREQLSSFMKFFSDTLNNTAKFEEVYPLIAEQISEITEAKGVCIYELHDDNSLSPVGYTKAFPPLQRSKKFVLSNPRYTSDSLKYEKIQLGDGIIGEVAKDKQGLLIEEASNDERLKAANRIIPIYTLMAVPMKMDEKVTGVICAINNKHHKPFTKTQFESLDSMAKLAVHVHSILKIYSNQALQQRLSQELEFTRLLQSSLLPKEFPEWNPFVINAFTRSAKEVNGDFYDFVEIDKDRLLVVIGDASGKGIPACMIMAMTRSFIRANIERFTNLSNLFYELNANLYRDTNEERFVSLSCCLLDKQEQTMEFARAGHTELLLYSNKDSIKQILPNGTALGLLPNEFVGDFDTFSFSFEENYSLMLFSDGITEMTNSDGEEFGLERLKELFLSSSKRKNSPRRCIDKVLRSIDQFSAEEEQTDDQTIVIISHESAFI
jgi:sigma-B regulation protein RsbU (phosphoserine phosphatase)